MKYKYEKPKKLIKRVVSYAKEVKIDGVLSIDFKIEKEKNHFLRLLLVDLVDNILLEDSSRYKRFIKYYVKELDCSKNQKYKIKKQLKMILFAVKWMADDGVFHRLQTELEMFYPRFLLEEE